MMLSKALKLWRCRLQMSPFLCNLCNAHQSALSVEEEVKYPPIIDTTLEGELRHGRQMWYDSIKELPTVQQKLYEMVSKHDYYSKVHRISSCSPTYAGVPFQSYITRTHFISGLPEKLQSINIDETYATLKPVLCDVVANSFSNNWRDVQMTDWSKCLVEKNSGSRAIDDILSLCWRILSHKHPHLLETTLDQHPKVSSYWYHGGFKAPKVYVKPEDTSIFAHPLKPFTRGTIAINKQLAAENLCFQFADQPYCTIKTNKPLPSIVPLDDALCSTAEVAEYNYLPKVFGIPFVRRYYINCLPGMWPGDPYDFPFVQIYTMDKLEKLTSKAKYHSLDEIENGFAAMASFGWLNGLATYQGFSPYHDLTYPIVGQTILTNGQEWKFFIYQLNTICFHVDSDEKDRRNLCWCCEKVKLFECIEDGELKGVNDDALKTLVKFILHKPEIPQGVTLKPYLGAETRTDEEIETMQNALRKLYRNTPKPNAHLEEIPMWQQVYKRHPDAPPSPLTRLK